MSNVTIQGKRASDRTTVEEVRTTDSGELHVRELSVQAWQKGGQVTATGTSQTQAIPAAADYIRFCVDSTADAHIELGDSGVSAQDNASPMVRKGSELIVPVGDNTDFAYIGNTAVINWSYI